MLDLIDGLKKGEFEKTVVLANRYDGIDLPDDACRILVFNSKPYSESLIDLYQESCRPDSEATLMRTIRTVEQGMGRSVRGEKDYCAIIVIGTDLVRLIRDRESRRYLSSQMAAQIELGLEIADMARQEIEDGNKPTDAFNGLLRQCLNRDADWKAFYVEQMDKVKPSSAHEQVLRLYAAELAAETAYIDGDYASASERLQKLLDGGKIQSDDRGWYLQEMARYHHLSDRTESQRLQVAAHKINHFLLKPPTGVTVAKLTIVSQGRVERIAEWVREEEKGRGGEGGGGGGGEWKEGPDNLWALDATQYLLFECKSEVDINRAEINRREAEQMNRSSAWFGKHYAGMRVKRLIIHPSNTVPSSAAFTHEVDEMDPIDRTIFVLRSAINPSGSVLPCFTLKHKPRPVVAAAVDMWETRQC